MKRESERTHVMKENFVAWFMSGFSIREIADKSNLSRQTVYRHLQEIADMYGVDRDEFLKIIRTPTPRQYDDEAGRTKVSAEKILAGFDNVTKSIDELRGMIKDVLKEEEE